MENKTDREKLEEIVQFLRNQRNPLAAVSGAAQMLTGRISESDADLLKIILNEVEVISKGIDRYINEFEFTVDKAASLVQTEIDTSTTKIRFRLGKKKGGIRPVD